MADIRHGQDKKGYTHRVQYLFQSRSCNFCHGIHPELAEYQSILGNRWVRRSSANDVSNRKTARATHSALLSTSCSCFLSSRSTFLRASVDSSAANCSKSSFERRSVELALELSVDQSLEESVHSETVLLDSRYIAEFMCLCHPYPVSDRGTREAMKFWLESRLPYHEGLENRNPSLDIGNALSIERPSCKARSCGLSSAHLCNMIKMTLFHGQIISSDPRTDEGLINAGQALDDCFSDCRRNYYCQKTRDGVAESLSGPTEDSNER